ncbi:MAG: hypothetical protein J6A67_04005 [Clostridia bacterium]|nr:hypothetical protein [Clostridia bacterium]
MLLSIFAILSDLPLLLAQWISNLTGADMSGFVTEAHAFIADAINAFEQMFA